MKTRNPNLLLALTLLLSAIHCQLSTALAQGPLTPPGAPAPTMKTLDQVEPRIAINATNTPGDADSLFKITQRGSYYLTGNIIGVIGKHGIEIVASGVTLDLNGFDLIGTTGMGAFDGVTVTAGGLTNIAVINGSVRSWGRLGVNLGAFAVNNGRVDRVVASGNVGIGIASGPGSTVSNCSTSQNGGGTGSGSGSVVSNCTASSNTGVGISVNTGCTVSNCSALNNIGNGIQANNGSTVSNCSADDNDGDGISVGKGCTVSNCSVEESAGNGISVGDGCTIADCSVYRSAIDGIVCSSACVIRGNTCSFTGIGGLSLTGIHATGGKNRIEGNTCTGANHGIAVDLAGNIIIKNTCASNVAGWAIAPNNVYGPILDRRAPASAGVLGASGPGSLGTTDPNANFTY